MRGVDVPSPSLHPVSGAHKAGLLLHAMPRALPAYPILFHVCPLTEMRPQNSPEPTPITRPEAK